MESYCPELGCGNEIYDTWQDGYYNGTGSLLVLGVTPAQPVHGGEQSMGYYYDNSLATDYYSEIDVNTTGPSSLGISKDWTVSEPNVLTLYFYGDPANAAGDAEQMYVGLEDSSGVGSYADAKYADMNDITEPDWHEWNIALQDFGDSGVVLTDVNKVYIGFGNRAAPTPGGTGEVYIDDIRLCAK
jgi:hypothetical protein